MTPFSRRADRTQRWALAAFCFFLLVSLSLANVAWVGAAVFGILLFAFNAPSRFYRWTGLEVPGALLLLTVAISAALSQDPIHSFYKLSGLVLLLVFVMVSQKPFDPLGLRALVLGAGLAAAVAVWQWFSGWTVGDHPQAIEFLLSRGGRAQGFFSNPITLAESLMMVFCLCLALMRGAPPVSPAWLWVGAGASVAGICLSGSRGVWLALLVVLPGWALIRRDRRFLKGLALAGLVGSVFLFLSPSLRHRLTVFKPGTLHEKGATAMVAQDEASQLRLWMWRESWDWIQQRPVWGVGTGHVALRIPTVESGPETTKICRETHNIYLQALVEGGGVGLIAFLNLLGAVALFLWRRRSDPWAEGALAGWVGLGIAGLTESWTHDSEVLLMVYFVLGATFARMGPPKNPPPIVTPKS